MQKHLPTFHTYSIKDLELLSNIKAHTLRIWEQRYGILQPNRTDTNIRTYSDADLRHLLNVSMLNQHGFKISHIASMSKEEIEEQVRGITEELELQDDQVTMLVIAMLDLDEDAFCKVMDEVKAKKTFEAMVIELLYPFMEKVGNLWTTGSVSPVQEHFVSNIIRHKLISEIVQTPRVVRNASPKFLLFTPENELHEIALLFYYYLLKVRQYDVVYIGINIPLYDLVTVFEHHQPEYIVSSFTVHPNKDKIKTYLDSLSGHFPKSSILLSGYQIRNYRQELPLNVKKIENVTEFIHLIQKS